MGPRRLKLSQFHMSTGVDVRNTNIQEKGEAVEDYTLPVSWFGIQEFGPSGLDIGDVVLDSCTTVRRVIYLSNRPVSSDLPQWNSHCLSLSLA